jgi:hypothetical protein
VRRPSWTLRPPTWSGLLWSLALLGVILLPSYYRAGAEIAHAHSLVQLWIDAADGAVHHHEESTAWFEPDPSSPASGADFSAGEERPDVGEHDGSTPTASGVHLLLSVIPVLTAVVTGPRLAAGPARCLTGQTPRVLLPPPRSC